MNLHEHDDSTLASVLRSFAYLVPAEKFVYQRNGAWCVTEPVGKDGISHHIRSLGVADPKQIRTLLASQAYPVAYGWGPKPGKGDFWYAQDGKLYLNTYHPPTLQPSPGDYPTIERVLAHLTDHDPAGQEWLCHWIASKLQDPTYVPKVAVVLATSPGAGKGTLATIIQEMLGPKNCATIKQQELESRFNARWIDKLFVLADEVKSAENFRDISNLLKVLIDGKELESEAKGINQRAVRNNLMWIFASNDRISPVTIEGGDRRYTVFSNHKPLPPEYRETLNACFEADRETPTPAFRSEMAGFFDDLLHLDVDRRLVSVPYRNTARDTLLEANLAPHELFLRTVDRDGIDAYLDAALHDEFQLNKQRPDWDFPEGISTQIIYKVYRHFVSGVGGKSMKLNRFMVALRNHTPVWTASTVQSRAGREVEILKVPRSTK